MSQLLLIFALNMNNCSEGEGILTSFQESTQPFEPFSIPFLLSHTAHEDFNRSRFLIPVVSRLNTQMFPQFVLGNCACLIDFIPQYHYRHLLQLRYLKNSLQLCSALLESLRVG